MRSEYNAGRLSCSWAEQIINTVSRAGIKYAVYSPGFRNAPLRIALEHNKAITVETILDERSAAFFALGIAKRGKEPVLMVCTSGTACGNLMPAMLEAYQTGVPLVVLTADRPEDLVGVGANQAMNQIGFFSKTTVADLHLEAPSSISPNFDHLEYKIQSIIHGATNKNPGPVHINIRFAEPLLPESFETIELNSTIVADTTFLSALTSITKETIYRRLDQICSHHCPLFLLGPNDFDLETLSRIRELSLKLNIPILADAVSGIGFGATRTEMAQIIFTKELKLNLLASYLRDKVDLLIQLGKPPLHKHAATWRTSFPQAKMVLITDSKEPSNPTLGHTTYLEGRVTAWVDRLCELSENFKISDTWIQAVRSIVDHENIGGNRNLDEIGLSERFVANHICKNSTEKTQIFLGNSMPIRDFNEACHFTEHRASLFHNRGLSGIDGLVSTAAGVAYEAEKKTILVIGDLSFQHDIGALATVNNIGKRSDLKIIVLNNDGGEIFRQVGTKNYGEIFTTPQPFCMENAARSFSIPFRRANSADEFISHFSEIMQNEGPEILEVKIDSNANARSRE